MNRAQKLLAVHGTSLVWAACVLAFMVVSCEVLLGCSFVQRPSDRLPSSTGIVSCDVPIMIHIDKAFSVRQAGWVWDAAAYWNEEIGAEIFWLAAGMDGPRTTAGSHIFVSKKPPEYFSAPILGLFIPYGNNACWRRADVLLNDVLMFSPDSTDTVMRHELGHALGLADSPTGTGLMAREVHLPHMLSSDVDSYWVSQFPEHVTADELRLVKLINKRSNKE